MFHNTIIYGAVIGDYGGSSYEFSSSPEGKLRYLTGDIYTPRSTFTDDTVLTVAVAHALLEKTDLTVSFRYFASRYPDAGYGSRFLEWLWDDDKRAYGSIGNGAAMRISPVPYFSSSEEECKKLTHKVTSITHNTDEAYKAAETVSMMIYYALHGKSKEELETYALQAYPRIKDLDLEDLHQHYTHQETCEASLPEALYAFLSSSDFEDTLRRACYIGGDADTIAAIACSIASAYYKYINPMLFIPASEALPKEFRDILDAVPLPKNAEDSIDKKD